MIIERYKALTKIYQNETSELVSLSVPTDYPAMLGLLNIYFSQYSDKLAQTHCKIAFHLLRLIPLTSQTRIRRCIREHHLAFLALDWSICYNIRKVRN